MTQYSHTDIIILPGIQDQVSSRPEKRLPWITMKNITSAKTVSVVTTEIINVPLKTSDGLNFSALSASDFLILPYTPKIILEIGGYNDIIDVFEGYKEVDTKFGIVRLCITSFNRNSKFIPTQKDFDFNILVGHRGAGSNKSHAGTYPLYRENTIESFHASFDAGAAYIETDLSMTSDGKFAIQHDQIVCGKPIYDMNSSEFLLCKFEKSVEIDSPRILLQDLLQRVNPRCGLNLELKFNENSPFDRNFVVQNLIEEVKRYGENRMIFYSTFDPLCALLLKLKQEDNPVLFLSDAGIWPRNLDSECTPDRDPIANVPEETIFFAKKASLDGIVLNRRCIEVSPAYRETSIPILVYGVRYDELQSFKQMHPYVSGHIVDLLG